MRVTSTFVLFSMLMIGVLADPELDLGDNFGVGIVRGRVFSFGSNGVGQLGIGPVDSDDAGIFSSEVHLLDEFGSGGIVAVSAGWDRAAAIDFAGTLFTWGDGSNGTSGLGNNDGRSSPTALAPFGSGRVSSVSCGGLMTYAIDSDGSLFGWGMNTFGQLGRPASQGGRNLPLLISVESMKKVLAVSAGKGHGCFITDDRLVYCLGHGNYGQLGNGDDNGDHRDTPTRIRDVMSSSNRYSQIGCGYWSSCGLDTAGNVMCWGRGFDGLLGQGIGVTASQNVPTLVVKSWGDETIESIAVGSHHTCVFNNVHAWCFGLAGLKWIPDEESKLSPGGFLDLMYAEVPVAMQMDGINGIRSLAAGDTTCIKDSDTVVHCSWLGGRAPEGQYEVLDFSGLDLPLIASPTSSPSPAKAAPTGPTSTEDTLTDDESSDAGVDNDNDDSTLYVILGATGAAFCCGIIVAVVAVAVYTSSSRNSKGRPVASPSPSPDGTQLKSQSRRSVHSSARSRRSVSRAASRAGLSSAGSRSQVSRRRNAVTPPESRYVQFIMSEPERYTAGPVPSSPAHAPPNNPYGSLALQPRYQPGPRRPAVAQYGVLKMRAGGENDLYERGDIAGF